MKRKLILISAVVMMFSLTACNTSNNTQTPEEPTENTNETVENEEPMKDDTVKPIEEVKEKNKVDENINKDNEKEKEEEPIMKTEMTDEEMIESSDYIAKVKMIQKGQSKFELKVLDNIKGNINASDVPNTENFQQNRAYVIFLKDIDGKVEPTNANKSYILLEGDNHEIFEKINKNVNR